MHAASSGGETFQQKVCRHFDIPPERYGVVVLHHTLYPHALWLRPFAAGKFLAPDRAFIFAVGRLTRVRGFSGEAWDFQHAAENRHFTRRALRLRVSIARMRVLFSEIWGQPVPAGADDSRDLSTGDTGSLLID